MPANVPDHKTRKNLERGLTELHRWRQHTLTAYNAETNPTTRARHRRLADDLEWLCWRLEQLLHPAASPTTTEEDTWC